MHEFPRGWLIPLMKKHITHTEIAFFAGTLYPLYPSILLPLYPSTPLPLYPSTPLPFCPSTSLPLYFSTSKTLYLSCPLPSTPLPLLLGTLLPFAARLLAISEQCESEGASLIAKTYSTLYLQVRQECSG